jgi:hypothetical protein
VNPKLMRVCEPGDELHDPSGLRLVFVDTPSASEGRRLELEWHVPPGARLVAADHYHPDGPEWWTVIEGSARHRLDGAERAAPAPAQWVVEASTPHWASLERRRSRARRPPVDRHRRAPDGS